MPSRYQTIFTIIGREQSGLSLLNEVRAFVLGRVSEQYGEPELATTDEGEWESENGQLRVDSDQREGVGFFSLNWKRKDGWELRWYLATQGEDVEAEIQVYGPDDDRRTAGPPVLLGVLFGKYNCVIRGEEPHAELVTIKGDNADWYLDSLIFNSERRIPVVAVSEGPRGDSNGTAVRALNTLRGVATVVTYSYGDGTVINKRLGRLACSVGEVRVYRPGADRGDAQELNRRWRQNAVDLGEVRDECMHLLSLSVGPRLYHEVREEIFRRWDAELAEAEEEEDVSEDEQIFEERLAALQGELTAAKQVTASFEADLDEWRAKHEALERESNRELGRLKQESAEASKTIAELLDQINNNSTVQIVTSKLRQDNAELSEKIKGLQSELEERGDQFEDVERLTRERDAARSSAREWQVKFELTTIERDELTRELESAPARTDKHSQRKAESKFKKEIANKDQSIEDLRSELRGMDDRLRERDHRIGELGEELDGYKRGESPTSDLDERQQDDEGESNAESIGPLPGPNSVIDVLREQEGIPGLRFLKSAYESAEKSPYLHFDELEQAIRAISDCGVTLAKGPLGMPIRDWFRDHTGKDTYRQSESETTNKKHPRIYRDDRCNENLDMQEHISLGGGGNRDPKDILRIHMAWCDKENLWIIGHVGRHLDVAGS